MTQAFQTRSIPLEQWCALAKDGAAPPVTVCLEGDSMRPLIRRRKDPVTVIPLRRALKKGDVVLFHFGGKYVVHRVWKLQNGRVQTFGDNCWNPDAWVTEDQVLGLVVKYRRGGRAHRLDTPFARAWGRAWMAIHPLRLFGKCLKVLLARSYRKLFPTR